MENNDVVPKSVKAQKISSIAIPLHNFEYTHHTHTNSKYSKKPGIIGWIKNALFGTQEPPPSILWPRARKE